MNRRSSDFLIVGAGSAGCVVARVLAQAGYTVRIIEAGRASEPSRRPAEYLQAFETAEDWGFRTVAQDRLAGRRLLWPRGRGPGGSTRINAMIWYPPRSCDLRMLHAHGGAFWNPGALAQSLAAVTDWVRPQRPRWLSEAARRFLLLRNQQAAVEPPAAFARMTGSLGRRTAADLLAESSSPSGSIEIVAATAGRVLFRGDRAIGVQTHGDGQGAAAQWLASSAVILCGGSIASPSILMRSGIGPRDVLQRAGIDVRWRSEAVGNELADHLIMPVIFSVARRHRFPAAFSTGDLARWQVAATGPVASNLAEAGAIYRLPDAEPLAAAERSPAAERVAGSGQSDASAGAAERQGECQVHVTPTHYLLHPAGQAPAAMTIGVNLCRPESRGQIMIASADPAATPHIDPQYLSDPADLEGLAGAVQLARQLACQPALARFVGEEKLPGPGRSSPAATIKAIQRFSQTLYHPTGTCRLGRDSESVVDTQCRVRGCEALYVIDASVLPQITSANPNATVMMLAFHVAAAL